MSSKLSRKWVDFGAAIAGGLVISYYSQSTLSFVKPMWSTFNDFLFTAIYVCAYAVAALVILGWRTALTVNFGWALIAVLGATLCATADELASRIAPDGALREVLMIPIGIAIYTLLTLPAMAIVHYLGLMLSDKGAEI
jgi:hypothetical protein